MRIRSQKTKEILKVVQSLLPKGSVVLVLCKAGPKFFGWEKKGKDEFYGIFHTKDFWEKISLEKEKLKIEMVELKKFLKEAPYRYTALCCVHLGSPIYVHPKFDYQGLRQLFSLPACSSTPLFKMKFINFLISPHSALQCYFDLLWRLHILKTDQFIFNLNKLKKYYPFPMIDILQKKPPGIRITQDERRQIKKDLREIYRDLKKLLLKKRKVSNFLEKWRKWEKKTERTFLSGNK